MPCIARHQRHYHLCKKSFFDSIRQQIIHVLLHDDSSDSSEEAFPFYKWWWAGTSTMLFRYTRNSYLTLESVLDKNDSNFLLHFRVQKDSFRLLVDEVKDYWEFCPRVSRHGRLYHCKAPIQNQLLVFLYVLGASGSDANYKKVASRLRFPTE